MATTVNNAFSEFLRNSVNLDSEQTKTARISRDNLLTNIRSFSEDDFFSINGTRSLNFGSFARHTKLRPLDDIDLMVCISGSDDRKYSHAGSGTYYMGANQNDKKNGLNMHKSARVCHLHGLFPPFRRRFSATLSGLLATQTIFLNNERGTSKNAVTTFKEVHRNDGLQENSYASKYGVQPTRNGTQ